MEALHRPGAAAAPLEELVLAEAELGAVEVLTLDEDVGSALESELVLAPTFDGVPQPASAVLASAAAATRMSARMCPFLAMAQEWSDPLHESISATAEVAIVSGL
jgi:hypothetical protein